MNTGTIEQVHVDPELDWDNPGRIYHLTCRVCVPVLPPVGTPMPRFCGVVLTRKASKGILANPESPPPEACVVCMDMDRCGRCGAPRWMCWD